MILELVRLQAISYAIIFKFLFHWIKLCEALVCANPQMLFFIFQDAECRIVRHSILNGIRSKLFGMTIKIIEPGHGANPEIIMFVAANGRYAVITDAILFVVMKIGSEHSVFLVRHTNTAFISGK